MSNTSTVYILKDRLNQVLFHWFCYVISGLYDLSHLPKPIKFHTKITEDFQRETVELLKPDYEFIEDIDGYNVVHHEGALLTDKCNVANTYYPFVRNEILIKNNLEYNGTPFRRIYISRGRSHLLSHHGGLKKRHMVNEHIIIDKLTNIGFECIHLEDYNLVEKIRLFQEAAVVVSPNGGALTMCYFANKQTKIIQIQPDNTLHPMYSNICETLSIPMISYENVRCLDDNGNETMPKFLDPFSMEIKDYNHFIDCITSASQCS
jgi:capsular polysaccharide biosynthesis protein